MPKKNKPAANGFMSFTMEWKAKYGKHLSINNATQEAGKIWATMSAEERAPYKEKAKEHKTNTNISVEKLTCTGLPISVIENEKRDQETKEVRMKRDVDTTISRSIKNNEFESKSYYFLMVNYFTKTLKGGVYVPAELAVCEYSLKDGIKRMYQTLISPNVNIFGHQYEAQKHSKESHNLPLPPNAMGEKDVGKIYNDILNFIRDSETNDLSPVYTHRNCIHIVESALECLKADVGGNSIDINIYPIQYLFFVLKENTCEMGELEKPKNIFITDAFFDCDHFEYQIGIACQYHEDIDRSIYCTQSYVTRWAYTFSDYLCQDIAIPIIPGRHCPKSNKLKATITPAHCSTTDDNASFISTRTASTYATKAVADSKIYYDDKKSAISDGESKTFTKNDNASSSSLGAIKKVPTMKTCNSPAESNRNCPSFADILMMKDECKVSNPWASHSFNMPREPNNTHFSIDSSNDESGFDDYNSITSFGRGRGTFASSSSNTSNSTKGSGRGSFLNK